MNQKTPSNDLLQTTIDSVGQLVADVLTSLPTDQGIRLAQDLESGAASVVITMHPHSASMRGVIHCKGNFTDLFTVTGKAYDVH